MDDLSLAEFVLFGLQDDSGIVPDGDLLERVEKAPPATRRRLVRLDAEVMAICATTPLEMSAALAALVDEGCDEDGRIKKDTAWDTVLAATRDGAASAAPDATAERLLRLAHEALGLDAPCQTCADWQPEDEDDEGDPDGDAPGDDAPEGSEDDEDEDEEDDDAHDDGHALLDRVFAVHADALDAWTPQVAVRIAAESGDDLSEVAGFRVLHDVVGHRRGVDGITADQQRELHMVQHVGMSLCLDVAQVHGLATSLPRLTDPASVSAALDDAEETSAQEAGVLAAVLASVVVDRIAPLVEESLESAPPVAPSGRPPRNRRRGRR